MGIIATLLTSLVSGLCLIWIFGQHCSEGKVGIGLVVASVLGCLVAIGQSNERANHFSA